MNKTVYLLTFITGLLIFFPLQVRGGIGIEEPKTIDDAQRMQQEGLKEKTDALAEKEKYERREQEALEAGDEETAKKDRAAALEADLKSEEGREKFQTGRLAEAQINLVKGIDSKNQEKTIISAKEELEKIRNKVISIKTELASGYEPPVDPRVTPDVQQYKDDLNKKFEKDYAIKDGKFASDIPISSFVDEQFDEAVKFKAGGLPDYKNQKSALKVLRDLLDDKISKNRDIYFEHLDQWEKDLYYSTSKAITERIKEIEAFESNPPPKLEDTALKDNALAKKLQLDKRIPEDQEMGIRSAIDTTILSLPKEEQYAVFVNAEDAWEHYDLEKGEDKSGLDDFIKNERTRLDPKKDEKPAIPTPLEDIFAKGVEVTQENVSTFIDEFTEKMADPDSASKILAEPIDKVGSMVRVTIEENPEYFDPVYEKIAVAGKAVAENAKKFEKTMNNAPLLVDIAIKVGELASDPVVGPRVVVPILASIDEVGLNVLQFLGNSPTAQSIVKQGIKFGQKSIRTIAELGTSAATWATEERIKLKGSEYKEKLETAQEFITEERAKYLTKENRSHYQKIGDEVSDFAKKVNSWINDQVAQVVVKFKKSRALDSYKTARTEYLDALGLPDNATEYAIKAKLNTVSKYSTQYDELQEKNKKLAKATYDLVTAYKEYADHLNGLYANMEFMVKAWDKVYVDPDKKADLIDKINNVVDLRNQRLEYLSEMNKAVKKIKSDLNTITVGTDLQGLNDIFAKNSTDMITGQMAKTIEDYGTLLEGVNNNIESELRPKPVTPPGGGGGPPG